MGIHDNQTLLSLTKNFRKPHCGKRPGAEHVAEGEAGSNRRQLVRVTYQNQPLSLGNRPQEAMQQLHIHHGHLVHNYHVTLKRIVLILQENHLARGRVNGCLQEPMDGGSLFSSNFCQTFGRSARRSSQKAAKLQLTQK